MGHQALGCVLEGNQTRVAAFEDSIEMLLRLPREAAEGCARPGARSRWGRTSCRASALPVWRGTLLPGLALTCGTVIAAPRGAVGPHGERAGHSGGDRSGSGRPRRGFCRKPAPAPISLQIAACACCPEVPAASAPGPARSRRLRTRWRERTNE